MAAPFRLAYITDVEGNIDWFERCVKICPVLSYKGDPALGTVANSIDAELVLEEGAYFVFGGDIVDKGPGDIRLCRQLVALKQKHPDHVFLIVGNRDLNKLRYAAELGAADLARPIDAIPRIHWDRKATTLREHLQSIVGADASEAAFQAANTRAERLRYMHLHTLGCAQTFEFRRQEMALLNSRDTAGIGDEEVVDNFLFDINDGRGDLRQYLLHGSAAALVGNTLFVHGAIDAQTMGVVPQHTRFELPSEKLPPAADGLNVPEWVAGMNAYVAAGLADHAARPDWSADRTTRGGESLMALQNRCAMWGRTVVSNCYADGGNIAPPQTEAEIAAAWARGEQEPLRFEGVKSNPRDHALAAWLRAGGVRRVVTGHRPVGDSPAVCSSTYTGVEVVTADTSFSDMRAADCRGAAVTAVLVSGESADANQLEFFGTLHDGRQYHGRLATLGGDGEGLGGDPLLGTEAAEGWWYKARVMGEGATEVYLQCQGAGRTVRYRDVPTDTHTAGKRHE